MKHIVSDRMGITIQYGNERDAIRIKMVLFLIVRIPQMLHYVDLEDESVKSTDAQQSMIEIHDRKKRPPGTP